MDLAKKVISFYNGAECRRLGLNAFAKLNTEYSEKEHYVAHQNIFFCFEPIYPQYIFATLIDLWNN